MSLDAWQSVLKINAEFPIQLTEQLFEKGLLKEHAKVLYVASVVGISGNFGQTNYAASKSALIDAVKEQSDRFSSKGVLVNAVAPGFIETAMTQKMPKMVRFFAKQLTSLKEAGKPEDVAEAACFLMSALSDGLTAQVLRICGQSALGA